MKIELDIPDKEFKKIEGFCDFNNIAVDSYLTDAIVRVFNIDRFGDLNKQNPPTVKIEEVIKTPLVKECKLMDDNAGISIVYDNGDKIDVKWDEITASDKWDLATLLQPPTHTLQENEQEKPQQTKQIVKKTTRRQIQPK